MTGASVGMHGFHNLEYRCGFIAILLTFLCHQAGEENSLLQVFAVANRGFVARGHRLAWLFAVAFVALIDIVTPFSAWAWSTFVR